MNILSRYIPILIFAVFISFGFSISKGIGKKVQKEVGKTFDVTDFDMKSLAIKATIN